MPLKNVGELSYRATILCVGAGRSSGLILHPGLGKLFLSINWIGKWWALAPVSALWNRGKSLGAAENRAQVVQDVYPHYTN
jgi:hypothetical protein